MNWGDLPYFLAVARGKTLAAAARRLKVDQATVGRRIRALEIASGARLFDRAPDGYRTTSAGEALVRVATGLEDSMVALQRELLGQDSRLDGTVRIAVGEPFAVRYLVPRLDRLRLHHPGIAIDVVTSNLAADLARREADFAIRISKRPKQANLAIRHVGDVGVAIYASESYLAQRGARRTRTAFAQDRSIQFSGELRDHLGADWLRARVPERAVAVTSNSILVVASAVAAGIGIGALPCYLGDADPRLRRVHPGVVGHREIWMIRHSDLRNSARVTAVMDHVRDLLAQDAALLRGKLPQRSGT